MNPKLLAGAKKLLSVIVIAVTLFFILGIFLNYQDDISSALTLFSKQAIIFACLFYLFYFYLRGLAWLFAVKAFGVSLTAKEGLETWFLGESTRYIPGNIWSFASRIYLLSKKKVPKSLAALSLIMEIILLILSGLIFSTPTIVNLLGKKAGSSVLTFTLYLVPVLILLGLLLFFLLKYLRKNFGHLIKQNLHAPSLVLAFLTHLAAWSCYGIANYNLVLGITGTNDPKLLISIPVFAWLVGYLSFVTPTGLGVREGILILLAAPFLGKANAGLLAILSRVTLVSVEVVNLGIWYWVSRKGTLRLNMKKMLVNSDLFILILMVLCYTAVFSLLSILRHNSFASSFDLGNMDQTIWNTLHGRIFTMSTADGNVSRLGTHADFILILLSPLYLLWNNVRMLLVFQSLALGMGAIPVYYLAKKILKNKLVSFGLVLLYLMNPGMQWANVYDFHGVVLAIPFLLAAFYFSYTKNWLWYWVFFFLALITKEEISLFLVVMGALNFVFLKNRRVGLLSILIGLIWFPLMLFVFIPHFNVNNQHWAFNTWFSTTKSDLDEHNYLDLVGSVKDSSAQSDSLGYYHQILEPFGYLPILGLPWVIMGIPELVINVLSNNPGMKTITLHYESGIIPALVISSIFAVRYLQIIIGFLAKFKKIKPKIPGIALSMILLLLTGVAMRNDYHSGPLPLSPSCWCITYRETDDDDSFDALLQTIPKNASISASSEVRPHLTHRQNAFNLPQINPDTQYVAMIDEARAIGGYIPHDFELSLIKDATFNKQFKLLNHTGHFYLYQRR